MEKVSHFFGVRGGAGLLHGVEDGSHAVDVEDGPDAGRIHLIFCPVIFEEIFGQGIGKHIRRGNVDEVRSCCSFAGQFQVVGVVTGIAAHKVGLDAQLKLLGAEEAGFRVVTGEVDDIRMFGFNLGEHRGVVLGAFLDFALVDDVCPQFFKFGLHAACQTL